MRTGKEKSNKTVFEVTENEVSTGMEPRRLPIMKPIKEMVELTGLSYTYLRNLCIRNEIIHIRTGKKYLINYDRFIDYLNGVVHSLVKKEKRQREGIAAKKARGEWENYGRPRAMDIQEFAKRYQAVECGEKRPFELMKELGLTTATFYRYKGMLKEGIK